MTLDEFRGAPGDTVPAPVREDGVSNVDGAGREFGHVTINGHAADQGGRCRIEEPEGYARSAVIPLVLGVVNVLADSWGH
jgi:hypothetical protein